MYYLLGNVISATVGLVYINLERQGSEGKGNEGRGGKRKGDLPYDLGDLEMTWLP